MVYNFKGYFRRSKSQCQSVSQRRYKNVGWVVPDDVNMVHCYKIYFFKQSNQPHKKPKYSIRSFS